MANENTYRVVVVAPINGFDRYFDLDLCLQRSVQSDATIASYPVQDAVTVSDHMFRNPRTISLSGAFSLNSRATATGTDTYTEANLVDAGYDVPWEKWFETEGKELKDLGSGDRLKSIQNLFEWIQAKGILCKIMMVSPEGNGARFAVRNNMALRSISWTEKVNSMDFTFGWYEVISVASIFGEFEWFRYDERYPSPVEPQARSLGEVLQESGDLVSAVVTALLQQGYIDKADAKSFTLKDGVLATTGKIAGTVALGMFAGALAIGLFYALNYVAGVAAGAGLAAAGAVGTAATALSATGVGLIVVAAAAIIAAVGFGIYKAIESKKKRDRLAAGFNLIHDYVQYVDKKTLEPTGKSLDTAKYNENDINRLQQLLNYVASQVASVMSNVTVYQITSDSSDNEAREFPLPVGNDLLYASIVRNNTANSEPAFNLSLFDGVGVDAKRVTGQMGDWPVCTNLNEMSRNSTVVHVTKDLSYECYLFNPSADPGVNSDPRASQEALRNLSNYYFVVCNGRMEENAKKLNKTIIDAIDTYEQKVK